ncbi:GDSL-type esterase/lipase family protein [Streptacidiphilus anmyonensis]|uniref:GDSL-type esterase/lipase family protein n=1 Tax=Streptacidiphilus anmyonensis TaxID=405782 RepID=UPI001F354E34|nr:GDSL-type esterase/lipase family protein [Streptacidiphilus anmyonensis]
MALAAAPLAGVLAVALASMWLAVRIAPLQSVSAAGQTVAVGAASPGLSLSGPGELDLFGQRIATVPRFDGPIRPRLDLTHITPGAAVTQLLHNGGQSGLAVIGHSLAQGWIRYAAWESVIAAGITVTVLLAFAGLHRMTRRRTACLLAAGLVAVCALNTVGFALLASRTPAALRSVHTLADLVGRGPLTPVPPATGPPLGQVTAVVIGDSTAAAVGNRALAHATALDRACGRSADSYAAKLASANHWTVLNLGCSGATIRDGLLGPQILGTQAAPPELSEAQRATDARYVIVSIGANDVHWADLTRLCAASPTCDDRATNAYFRAQLTRFTLDYQSLLTHLAALPGHPSVIVNEYYDPFGTSTGCLASEGLTTAKAKQMRSRLSQLNTILRNGALASGFAAVQPDFSGHQLCDRQPFVQGPAGQAPFHPTAAGELAIALADQQAMAGGTG